MLTYWKTKGKIIDKNTQIKTSIPASAKITATTSPEIELLLCCARTQIDDATAEQINKLVEQEIDWANLLQIADRHRVFPLLTQSLLATCPEAVPPDILARLRHLFHAQGQHNLALTSKLLKILNLFKEHNIDAIPFKGPVLAASAYSNLLLRQNGDLDLLVKESDFQKAIDLLISQGYVQTIQVPWEVHLTYKDGRNSIDLDLHREIVPKHLSCSLSSTYVWTHLESFSLAGKIVSTLSPEASLLILCLNGNKECWRRLNRVCDVAEFIRAHPNLDWPQVMNEAETMGFKRLIFLGLLLAHKLLGVKLPEYIWQQIQSDSVASFLFGQISTQLFSQTGDSAGTVETTFFHIKTRERWQDKVQSFWGLMLLSGWLHPTARDRDVIPLPGALSFLYYLIRPIRVSIRYRKILFKQLI